MKWRIFFQFSDVSTYASKKGGWKWICEEINEANNIDHNRAVGEVKKKWPSYMSETKKKAAQNQREAFISGIKFYPGKLLE